MAAGSADGCWLGGELLAWRVTTGGEPRPGGTSQKTGPRTHRHHQHRGPGAPDQFERNETPDPLRPDAVKARFQCVRQGVRQQSDRHDQHRLTGNVVLVALM
jgi:hypothetical protein